MLKTPVLGGVLRIFKEIEVNFITSVASNRGFDEPRDIVIIWGTLEIKCAFSSPTNVVESCRS